MIQPADRDDPTSQHVLIFTMTYGEAPMIMIALGPHWTGAALIDLVVLLTDKALFEQRSTADGRREMSDYLRKTLADVIPAENEENAILVGLTTQQLAGIHNPNFTHRGIGNLKLSFRLLPVLGLEP